MNSKQYWRQNKEKNPENQSKIDLKKYMNNRIKKNKEDILNLSPDYIGMHVFIKWFKYKLEKEK